MKRTLIAAAMLAMAQFGQAQQEQHRQADAQAGQSPHEQHRQAGAPGAGAGADWTEYDYTLRAGNAQGIEQCFYLAGEQTVTWHFAATADLLVNFHVHPDRDGEYHTVYLERADDVRDGEGVFAAVEAGAYCFEFGLRQPSREDIGIQLRFRVE